MSTKKRLILIVVALLLVLAGGLGWWRLHHVNGSANALVLYGNVDLREVDLAFNGAERIASMNVNEGQHVRKGELLAALDTQRLQYNVANAEAQRAAQQQVVARLEAGSRPEEIRQLRAEQEAAAAELRNAQATYRRVADLSAKKLASPQQLDDARTARDAAEARLKAADETLKLAVLGPRKEDIAAAKATLQAFEAQLALAKRNLADAALYAPSDGVIQNRILEPGDMASPQRPVYSLALTDPIWVRTYVGETDLGKLRPGMSAQVSTDSYPGKTYRAWIGYISPTAEFTPKAVETTRVRTDLVYQVRVYVCNPQDELRLGMPATVTIALNGADTGAADTRCPKP